MVEARPESAARPVEHEYTYLISDEFVRERIELEGVELPKRWLIKFALADLPSPGERSRALVLRRRREEFPGTPLLHRPVDDPVEFLDRLEKWIEEEGEQREQERELVRQEEIAAAAESTLFDDEMSRWISTYGSQRLKMARKKRYKVTSSYARARGRSELPGCWIDTAGLAEYRERVDPSAEALKTETRVEEYLAEVDVELATRIVWLVAPPSGLAETFGGDFGAENYWEFEQQEAILLSSYLGRYEAFYFVDRAFHSPTTSEEDD
jgi:hypothetical protein